MSEKFYVGQDLTSFEHNGDYKPVSRITLALDDDSVITVGDDTGCEISANCPYATQDMAERLLSLFKGHVYRAYNAESAKIDPSMELGDYATVNGLFSVIAQIADEGNGYPSISAPGKAELEDEYIPEGPMTRAMNRKFAGVYSTIAKTASEIRLEVAGVDDKYTQLSVALDGVTITDEEGTTRIKGSSIDTSTISAESILADQIKLGGELNFYQSLDSENTAGAIGYMDSRDLATFMSGMALGIQADGNGILTATDDLLVMSKGGNAYVGSAGGLLMLAGTDVFFNGQSIIKRITTLEQILSGLT